MSSSGIFSLRMSTSLTVISQPRPLLNPLYGLEVSPDQTMAELEAKPPISLFSISLNPSPPPSRNSSMNIPQNTPNPVSRLRPLFRASVSRISLKRSMSKNFI